MSNNLTLSVKLTGDGKQLSGTLKDAQGDVQAFGGTTEREGGRAERSLANVERRAGTVGRELQVLRRLAAPVGAALAGMFATRALQGQVDYADQLQKTNLRIGASVEALSQYNHVASLSGVEFGNLTTAWQRQTRRISEAAQGTGAAKDALEALGLSAKALNQLAPEDQFERIAEALQGVESQADRTALAMKLWDTEGVSLLQITNQGTDAIRAMREEADRLGLTISQDTADAMANYNDEMARFQAVATGVTRQVASELVPAMTTGLQTASEWVDEMGGAAEILDTVKDAGTGVAVVMAGRYVGAIAASQAALTAKAAIAATTTGTLNLLTGATTRQAAAATAMAGATRAATGAMTLLGGPLGLLVGAGGLLYAFREELGLVRTAAEPTTQRIDNLTDAIKQNSVAAVEAGIVTLATEYFALGQKAASATAEIERLTQAQDNDRQGAQARLHNNMRLRDMREELAQVTTEQDAAGESIGKLRETLASLGKTVVETTDSTTDLADANETAAAKTIELSKSTEAQADALEDLYDRLIPGRRETVQLARDMQTLTLAMAMGTGNIGQNIQAMGLLQQQYIDAQNDTDDLADKTVKAAYTMEGAWDEVRLNGLRRLDDGFASLWEGAIDGSLNAGELMKKALAQTLAEMAHMAITRPITVQLATSMGLNGGAGGGAGGFGINPGSIGNIWKAAQGGFNSIQWGGAGGSQAYGGSGFANAATSGTGATGFLGGSMQNFSGMQGLAGLGAGFAGNYLGGQLFGQGSQSNTLGAVGGIAGTYLGGPIGALLGSGLGSALGGLFGGRSWNETGSGVNLGVSGGDITGNQFSDQHSKGGLFRSSRRRTRTSALDGEFSGALQEVYDATEQSLAATIEVLGFQSSALTGFTTGLTRIDTKGLSAEDAEAKIQEWLSNTLNALAIHSVGDVSQFALGGETTIETVERLAVALGSLNPILEQLHGSTLAASMAGGSAASHLADLAGGIDAFSARADFYYQNVLTETERQERAMAAAAQAMGAFTARTGQVINSTDALRDLVDGIDLTTASGRELYNEAMNLAPALVEIERGLERVGQRFDEMLRDAESTLASAEQQARRAYEVFDRQQYGMQLELLELMGDAEGALALERERELATIDEALRPMRERIWAMQDEAKAQERATKAAQNYIGELTRVRDQLNQQLGNIGNWLDQQQATSGSPEMNLATAQEQLAKQLVLIENGDRDALQNITQYADRVLQANDAYNASSPAGQRIEQDVFDSLKNLPKALSDAEFIVEGFRGIVSNEMAAEIERAIFASQYTIDALIDFAADASALPQDLRTILGQQAHRLDSTLNYLLGENELDNELRQLALASSNNLVATVDYIARRQLSDGDKRLALDSSNTMSAVIDYVVRSELDRDSKRLALESSNAYSAMINMILGRDITADDRTLALDSANRYTTLVDYVVRAELTGGNRRLALSSLNEYQTLIDYATRKDVSSDDRKLALTSGNRYLSTMDYIIGRDIDDASKTLALDSNHRYLSTINYILGQQLSDANKRLALDTANRFDASVRYITEAEITGGDRRLALSAGQTFDALVQYFSDNRLTKDEQKLALASANRYVTTMDYIRGRDIDATSKALALGATNRYISTVNIVLGSNIGSADRRLALNSTNRYDAVIRYVVDAPITGGDRRLALSAGQQYEALIGYYVSRDITKSDRTLALNSANRYLANVEFIVGRDISSSDRRLALNSNNRYVSTIDQLIGKKIGGGDRRLALNSTNAYLTTVDAVLKRGIPADVRTFGLANSNAIMTTVDGIIASKMSGDVRTLALQSSNQFVTTLEAALKDGRITGDERKLLDAKSANVIKTLKTSGALNLTKDEWAVINAASGTQRLQLLADVAFGRTDLDHLKDIDDNTKSLEERAFDQLKELNGLVSEMTRTTDQFVGLNSGITSLTKSINALGVAQAEVARIEKEQAAAEKAERDKIDKQRQITGQAADVKSHISRFDDLLTGQEWNKYVNQDRADQLQGFGWVSGDINTFEKNIEDWSKSQKFTAYAGRYQAFKENREDQLEGLRDQYRTLTGSLAPFANGGWTGPGGKWDPAGIVHAEEFVVRSEVVKQPGVRGMLEALNQGQPTRRSTPSAPLPNFPLLGKNDVVDVLRDLKREVAELRRDNARLQGESNKHLSAANNQRGAAAKGQIGAIERGNKMLKKLEDDKRLEAAKR